VADHLDRRFVGFRAGCESGRVARQQVDEEEDADRDDDERWDHAQESFNEISQHGVAGAFA